MPLKVELGRKATYQDVLDAPDHLVAEIIGGDLYLSERPAPRPGLAMFRPGTGLARAFDPGRCDPDPLCLKDWWMLREPELRLGGHILAPDLVGWRRERMESLPDTRYFTLAPDWVCQVLSTEQHRRELPDRRRLYAREGVRHLWLVHLLGSTKNRVAIRRRIPIGLISTGGISVEPSMRSGAKRAIQMNAETQASRQVPHTSWCSPSQTFWASV